MNALHAYSCLDRAQRYPITVPLRFRAAAMSEWIAAKTVNISRTGILFQTDQMIQKDCVLDVHVIFTKDMMMQCRCSVIRTEAPLVAVQIQRHTLSHRA